MRRLRHVGDSDRNVMLLCLSIPFLLAVVAFVLAVALTAFGAPTVGTLRSTTAGFAYVYLTLGLMWLPAYLVACGWFWWATHDDGGEENLLKRLMKVPLVGAAFIWFPAVFFTPVSLGDKARIFPALAVFAIVGGYIWVGLIRLMFRAWRRT